ncbi:transcriptional adapter 2 [Nannochloropsis gaditana]|uniref:Transcriptional adapter 2 n=1 Tax=Nannochloropsis gaditana TaxID=72520 RepID=W7TTU5_9STRA|nr:transcriptional adapter 2 [Nannochloropsis gaditana]
MSTKEVAGCKLSCLLPLPRAWPSGYCLLIDLRLPILSPGVELLSGKEKELCAGLRLLPKHYLYIKNRILQESEACGLLPAPNCAEPKSAGGGETEGDTAVPPSSLVTMDVEKKKGVYDFMVRVGWVSPLVANARSDVKDITVKVNRSGSAPNTTGSSSLSSSGQGKNSTGDGCRRQFWMRRMRASAPLDRKQTDLSTSPCRLSRRGTQDSSHYVMSGRGRKKLACVRKMIRRESEESEGSNESKQGLKRAEHLQD